MDPIEAYLKRTGYWLPRERRQSILAELRGVLLERVDVAAERRGRPLTSEEMASLARDFGHPRWLRPVMSKARASFPANWRISSGASCGWRLRRRWLFRR